MNQTTKRPPIVTIMGHVDHGKTSLLDALAKTDRAAKEEGGITQGLAAFSVNHKERPMTFIDTPGHEAFLSMRRRGGQMADVILLVIDSVEGVKPQTQEALNHLRQSQAQPIVVLTKADLPGANPDVIKRQLADNGLLVEGWGGDVPVMSTSIKDLTGLEKLLDLILLVTDLYELKGTAAGSLEAIVVESLLDRKRGPLSLVVIRSGALSLGQEIYSGEGQTAAVGKIRGFLTGDGRALTTLTAGQAAWVLGFNKPPPVGQPLKIGKEEIVSRPPLVPIQGLPPRPDFTRPEKGPEKLRVVLKAQTWGSLEALTQALTQSPELAEKIEIFSSGVSDINESDVKLAREARALVVGFRVRLLDSAKKIADDFGLVVNLYDVIYKLLADLKLASQSFDIWRKQAARPEAEVLKIFTLPSGDLVIGGVVRSGAFRVNQLVHVSRQGQELFQSRVKNLKIGKNKVEKVTAGLECGFLLEEKHQAAEIKSGDLLSA